MILFLIYATGCALFVMSDLSFIEILVWPIVLLASIVRTIRGLQWK